MSITEIQQAVTHLPKADYLQFQAWLTEYDNQLWDKEIAQDLASVRCVRRVFLRRNAPLIFSMTCLF